MSDGSASQNVLQLAASGDRVRRGVMAWRRIVTLAPRAAVAAMIASAVTATFGGPRSLGLGVLGVATVVAGAALWAARRQRPVSSEAAAELDRAAGLGGTLHSAHWFAGRVHPADAAGPEEPWIAFHLDQAAARVEAVDWHAVYANPPARRAWAAVVAATILTSVLGVWPASIASTRSAAVDTGIPEGGEETNAAMPLALLPKLVEGVKAVRAGRPLTEQELAAIGQALQLAGQDRSAQEQLEKLLAEAASDSRELPSWMEAFDPWNERSIEEEYYRGGELSREGLDWAFQEAMAKTAEAKSRPAEAQEAAALEAPETDEPGEGDPDAGSSDSSSGSLALAEVQSQAASFSSLLFGKQYAKDGAGRTAANATRAALAAALRNEVVHARTDVAVVSDERTPTRRSTNQNRTPAGVLVSGGPAQYDRARASEPAAIPEVRRRLVHDYFLRPAEAAAPPAKP